MNPLDKAYRGHFYIIALVISVALSAVGSPALADMPWVGAVSTALTMLALLVQRFTPIGDKT